MADKTQATEKNTVKQGAQGGQTSAEEPKTFTQEQIDALVEERLVRDRKSSGYYDMKEKAEKYDELQEASKTELQKLKERAEKAEVEIKALKQNEQIEAWKQEVSEATGVKTSLLSGTTKEEIEKHAQAIKETYDPPAAPHISTDGKRPVTPGKTAEALFGEALDQLGGM